MAWRVARSLLTLRGQIDERYPNRSRISDGTIGDADHQNRQSDHNPWYGPGIVTALDITHDPTAGVDIDRLTDELQASRDPRIKYVIANRLIMSGQGGPSPWVWRGYSGSNPHTRHMHVSVVASPLCDDPRPWDLPSLKAGGGGAVGGGDDMFSDQDRAKLDHLIAVVGKRYPRGAINGKTINGVWHGDTGEYVRVLRREIAALRDGHGRLFELLAQQNQVTATDIAAALRAGLAADLLPVLREVVGEALGDDNAETADAIASSVLDKLGARLQGGEA